MEIFLRLYGFLNKVVNYLLTPFLMLIFSGYKNHESLPKIDSPILEICAVDLAEKIRNKEVRSKSYLGALLIFEFNEQSRSLVGFNGISCVICLYSSFNRSEFIVLRGHRVIKYSLLVSNRFMLCHWFKQ